jgi:hypothetical protein
MKRAFLCVRVRCAYQVGPPQLVDGFGVVELDVQVLVDALERATDLHFVLQLDGDLVLDERLEETIARGLAGVCVCACAGRVRCASWWCWVASAHLKKSIFWGGEGGELGRIGEKAALQWTSVSLFAVVSVTAARRAMRGQRGRELGRCGGDGRRSAEREREPHACALQLLVQHCLLHLHRGQVGCDQHIVFTRQHKAAWYQSQPCRVLSLYHIDHAPVSFHPIPSTLVRHSVSNPSLLPGPARQ